ncbi:hypothetical protein [Enterobacter cloacae complex sp. 279F5]|uniref:hypothetical protein n=1 Tax=Enterobacter cloacae complex sp. 279F5 TaxID=3395874 RepID=UPI003CE7BC43
MKLNYEELEARCAALAAENAGLKSAIDATIGWQQSTDPENVESVRMLVDIKNPSYGPFSWLKCGRRVWRCLPSSSAHSSVNPAKMMQLPATRLARRSNLLTNSEAEFPNER